MIKYIQKGCVFLEKDYFKDRSIDASYKDKININSKAFICLKEDQVSAKTINDLTLVTINKILTPIDYHPRGIKVSGQESDYFNPNFQNKIQSGRITYLMKNDYSIVTKNGLMAVVRNDDKISVSPIEDIKYKKRIILWFGILDFSFSIVMDPFLYLSENDLLPIINLYNPELSRTGISYDLANVEKVINNNVCVHHDKDMDLNSAFLEVRNALDGSFGITGYTISIPLKFIGMSLQDVRINELYE